MPLSDATLPLVTRHDASKDIWRITDYHVEEMACISVHLRIGSLKRKLDPIGTITSEGALSVPRNLAAYRRFKRCRWESNDVVTPLADINLTTCLSYT